MRILRVSDTGRDYVYQWPENQEIYPHWVDYLVADAKGVHTARVGFGKRDVYGRPRPRVVVWIDGKPEVEFFGTDDYDETGDLVSELKGEGNKILRHPEDPVPAIYEGLHAIPLHARVTGPALRGAWGAVCNVSDHQSILRLAGIRRHQRAH